METNSITNIENLAVQKSAKKAGIAYLVIIVTSILSMVLGPFKLMVEGDMAATINNIATNQSLFRAGFTYDLLMFIGVIILSVALYNVLKTVNKTVSLVALLSRFGEALVGSLTVVCGVIILALINGDYAEETTQKTISLIFEIKDSLMNLVFAFLGFGSILFCYNFYISKYIPKWLALFGIIAFVIVFLESIAVLLFPVESLVFTGVPAILFEITVGLWLMIKGVDLSKSY